MIFSYFCFGIMVVMVIIGNYQYYRRPKKRKLFDGNNINIEYAMLFSVDSISKAILRHQKISGVRRYMLKIKDDVLMLIRLNSVSEIKREIINFQKSIMDIYYNNLQMDDTNDVVLDIWFTYSQKSNYRETFLRTLKNMYLNNEISQRTYDKAMRKYFKF